MEELTWIDGTESAELIAAGKITAAEAASPEVLHATALPLTGHGS